MTTIPNYIDADDVRDLSSSPNLYLRTFDPNTTGSVDTAFLGRAIDDACSQWNTWMADALPGDWTQGGGTVDGIVKRHLVALCYFFSVDLSTEKNPYQRVFDAAEKYAGELRRGRTKLLTATVPAAPLPRPHVVSPATVDDSDASPFIRAAAGSIVSGF
jgi:hypothetical protein